MAASVTTNSDSIASRTRSKCKTASSTQVDTINDTQTFIDRATKLWAQLNDSLAFAPCFQNITRNGVSEERIKRIESKLKLTLPAEICAAVRVHDGRDKIRFGMSFRLATTDLLPIAKWRPYEMEGDGFSSLLFEYLAEGKDHLATRELSEDARDHLAAYIAGIKNKHKNEDNLAKNKAFHDLPCELLIIGEGMDDYAEQYLLSVRTGRIYLAIQNLPEWTLIGTFANWIEMGIENANDEKKNIEKLHDALNSQTSKIFLIKRKKLETNVESNV